MRRRLLLAAAGLVVVTVAGPLLIRQVPFFRIRRIELVGVRYLDPQQVLRALALDADQNLFDPLDGAARRVEGLAGVESVDLDRRPPGTLRVRVAERTPAAFVSGREAMIPLDCAGRPLPYEPAATGLDLPLVSHADRGLVSTLCLVRRADAALFQDVELARFAGDGAVTLELRQQRVRLRRLPTTEEIQAVGVVRRHLADAGRHVGELDARFEGWVVARRERS